MPTPVAQALGAFVEGLNSAALSPAWPAHAVGDIGLLIIESSDSYLIYTNLQGFKELPWSPQKAGPSAASATTILRVFWKRAVSDAEASPAFNAPAGAASHARALIATIRGASPEGTPWDSGDGDSQLSSITGVTLRSIDTVDDDCLILHIISNSTDNASASSGSWANANLTDIVKWLDNTSIIGNGSGITLVTGKKNGSGSISQTTGVLSHASKQGLILIAFSAATEEEDKSPYRGNLGTPVESVSADVSPAWPTHVAGDIGILVAHGGAAPALAVAQGFTQIASIMAGSGGAGIGLGVWWKRAESGAEPAPTVDFNTDHIRAMIFTVKAAEPTGNPINVSANEASTVAESSVVFPALQTTTRDCLVLGVLSNSWDSSSDDVTVNWTKGSLEGVAEFYDQNSLIGGGGGFQIFAGRMKTPGLIGSITADLMTSSHQAKVLFALEGLAGETVEALTGAFVMTGQDATFLHSRVIEAETGVFALTGGDAEFPIHLHENIQAETGAFLLSGGEAIFRTRLVGWSREVSANDPVWTKEPPLS